MNEEDTVNTGVQASGEAHGKAFGRPYFDCDKNTFSSCLAGRRKGRHWKKFTGSDVLSAEIKAFLKKNPKQKSIMLRNSGSDHFIMANKEIF